MPYLVYAINPLFVGIFMPFLQFSKFIRKHKFIYDRHKSIRIADFSQSIETHQNSLRCGATTEKSHTHTHILE